MEGNVIKCIAVVLGHGSCSEMLELQWAFGGYGEAEKRAAVDLLKVLYYSTCWSYKETH